MKCTRCGKEMDEKPVVYRINGLNGYFCRACTVLLAHKLSLPFNKVLNIPYYTD